MKLEMQLIFVAALGLDDLFSLLLHRGGPWPRTGPKDSCAALFQNRHCEHDFLARNAQPDGDGLKETEGILEEWWGIYV